MKQEKILIVEDTQSTIDLINTTLREQGYDVSVARNGTKALKIVPKLKPDLILMDILMPEMDGYETCRRLKEDNQMKDIPVIFLSALNKTFDKVKAFKVGGVDYLDKPIETEELLVRIETHLAIGRLRNELIQANLMLEEKVRIRTSELVELNMRLEDNIGELYIAKEKAEESDRLKTMFLHNISHEIRTPLNAICGFSELLEKNDLSPDKRKLFAKNIKSNGDQLLIIITDIISISEIMTGQVQIDPEVTNVNKIISSLLSSLKKTMSKKNISISANLSLDENQAQILTDKTKLAHILFNLISNAIKFTENGSVNVGYKLETMDENLYLQFFIKDTGIGIKSQLFKKIFEPFRQADETISERYGGTGLGLSISMAFVELLGGKIWVDSKYGEGSTFYFTVPYEPISIS